MPHVTSDPNEIRVDHLIGLLQQFHPDDIVVLRDYRIFCWRRGNWDTVLNVEHRSSTYTQGVGVYSYSGRELLYKLTPQGHTTMNNDG